MLGSGAKTQNLTMKKKRHTTEEIIRILRKADGEQTVEEVCREFNISEQTFYRWRRKYGRMDMADAKRIKEDYRIVESKMRRSPSGRIDGYGLVVLPK